MFVPILNHIVSVFRNEGFTRRVRTVHRPLKNVRGRTEKKGTTTRPETEKGRTPDNYSLENN
jgi:hypothetical protein